MLHIFLQVAPPEPIQVVIENPNRDWWSDPAFLGLLIPLLVVLVTVWSGNRTAIFDRAASRRLDLATRYGEAFADALAWCELPHRIARRTADGGDTLAALADRFHALQERIEYHRRWIQLDSSDVGGAYDELVRHAKSETRSHIEDAWARSPITHPKGMILGDGAYEIDISSSCALFTTAVERHLTAVAPPRIFGQGARTT